MGRPQRDRAPVLFLHASDGAYGGDRVLLMMARGALDRGRRVSVLLPDDTERGWLTDQLATDGIAVRRGPLAVARRRYLQPRALPGYIRSLAPARRFIRSEATSLGAGIIHANTSALFVATVVGRPKGARLVWHVHEIAVGPAPVEWLFRSAPVLAADHVITVSDAVRRHLATPPVRRAAVTSLHNGLEPREPAPAVLPVSGSPIVAFVGRLNRWKGYELFIDATAEVAPEFPGAAFLVAGDPPPGDEWRAADLIERIGSRGLAQRVAVLGFHADPAALFDAVDIVVVPSTLPDPLPTVVLEAMRSGCAVVASAHGGVPEMIEDGRSGILVPPRDAPALADALRRLLRDPELVARLGNAARERVRTEFTLDRFLDGVEAIYRSLGR